jgi:hypothetical protein
MALSDRWTELRETVEQRTNRAVVAQDELKRLQESDYERRMLQRDLDLLAYTALNYVGHRPQELKAVERRRLAQRSRITWMKDPQAGAAVDLMNDFVFGRGMKKPKANDKMVQQVLDDFWDDPDNQLILFDFQSQLAQGTDLELQSNLFFLIFEDGEDGKVKLSLLDHDTVETVVRDPDNRMRIMYYLARHFEYSWNYNTDQPQIVVGTSPATQDQKLASAPTKQDSPGYAMNPVLTGEGQVRYYPHWRNVEDAVSAAKTGAREMPDLCPPEKLGEGKVYHIAINRGMEMAFGHPRMDRVIRWFNSFNTFMDARVDMMSASAAFVMKRKVRGTPQQLQRMANQALSRRSTLGMSMEPNMMADVGPKAAAIMSENDSVDHEPFNLNSNAQNAQADAQMLRSQISAATRWPASYYGDASQANLATATSLELPVLKAVETRQEIFESFVRFCCDRAIQRAVDTGNLDLEGRDPIDQPDAAPGPVALEPGDKTQALAEAYEDQDADEVMTSRDLGYEFSMPNPLKRMIGDLVTAAQLTAQAFDPNNTNTELSRTLLEVVLAEAFEIEDPAGAVERIFPKGYVDPVQSAQLAAAPGGGGGQPETGEFSPEGGGGSGGMDGFGQDPNNGVSQGFGAGNPYGAAQSSQAPEDAYSEMQQGQMSEGWYRRAEALDKVFNDEFLNLVP